VLIVDDEAHMREITAAALSPLTVKIFSAESAERALEVLCDENVDVIISDIRMPGMDGLAFLRRIREEQPGTRFMLITAHGNMTTVIEALRGGASDFLAKPFDNGELRDIVTRLLPRSVPGCEVIHPSALSLSTGLIGNSPPFLACLEIARKAARTGSTVFITGESGTGKEGMARFIHEASDRRDGPFIPVNCGAIPENLIESELFGHARGAFTGAVSERPGKFALADGGTLFLDEIGEMPPAMQVRLLRVLQERTVEPVGGAGFVRTDFRLIAATHRNLREDVRAGRFREDLWFRLHVVPVVLPPLRDRGDDIVLLARHFLDHFNARYGRSFALCQEHERILRAHSWSGNVRELANAIERAVVLSDLEDLILDLEETGSGDIMVGEGGGDSAAGGSAVRDRRRQAEREVILAALESSRWNKTQAAASLGISRRGLLYKIKEYGI
jgi:DNA-binding NtrC family response regulator